MAESARLDGNEGRARVCARRAAGLAAQEFLERNGFQHFAQAHGRSRTTSAYQALQVLAQYSGLAPDLRQSARYLTLRVNDDFLLPASVDLIAEARKLCERLAGKDDRDS